MDHMKHILIIFAAISLIFSACGSPKPSSYEQNKAILEQQAKAGQLAEKQNFARQQAEAKMKANQSLVEAFGVWKRHGGHSEITASGIRYCASPSLSDQQLRELYMQIMTVPGVAERHIC